MKLPLPEIEFELTAYQYEMMGFPGLKQGEPVSVVLEAGKTLGIDPERPNPVTQ